MTGLSVLYANEAAKERDWTAVPGRNRAGRLREVYWAHRTKSKLGRKATGAVTVGFLGVAVRVRRLSLCRVPHPRSVAEKGEMTL